MPSKDYDWRSNIVKRGWKYEKAAPFDEQWQKDRAKAFKENGNGWWWYSGASAVNTPEHLRIDRGGRKCLTLDG